MITLNHVLIEFLKMSYTASLAALVVILIRFCMKRLPKIYSYLLWSIVLFRLICPVSFTSGLSLYNLLPDHMAYTGDVNFTQ